MNTLIYFVIVFLHIIADFNLQGVLAKLKVKSDDGKSDYIAALLIHGYSWSFMVHLPFIGIMVLCDMYQYVTVFALSLMAHAVAHAIIDTCKANLKKLDLVDDQLLHLIQIHIIWITTVFTLLM